MKKGDTKTSTIFIRGLPDTISDEALKNQFSSFGDIRSAFVVKSKSQNGSRGAGSGLGYVKYTTIEEATKAIENIKMIDDHKVIIVHARKKPRKFRKPATVNESKDDSGLDDTESESEAAPKKQEVPVVIKSALGKKADKKQKESEAVEPSSKSEAVEPSSKKIKSPTGTRNARKFPKNDKTIIIQHLICGITSNNVRKKCRKIGAVKDVFLDGTTAAVTFADKNIAKAAIKKLHHHVYKQQVITVVPSTLSEKAMLKLTTPSRLIVRNLSFKITEDILKEEMSKFGKVSEVSIAKNKENKMLGYAFVAFVNKFEANKAIQKLNNKELLQRKVAVDWAVPKEEYQRSLKKKKDEKNEETVGEDQDDHEINADDVGDDDVGDDDESIECDPEDDSMSVELDSDEEKEQPTHVKKDYNDIHEGRTLFIGNLPFDAEKEDVTELFSVFGELRYVRFVYDYEKDRPKGIAFLQFLKKEDADKCLKSVDDTPLLVGGRDLSVSRAIDKNSVNSTDDKIPAAKDNRNLHLATEGGIKEGSSAAQGVSKLDMQKRKQALEDKKKKLKNLNMFVSTTRLCVRNMPASFSEHDLKKLMSKYGNVLQVKIMRDIHKSNTEGIGRSKGYGFVQFQKEDSALKALRSVNNNPSVFTAQKRPIVDFSIENSNIIKAREKKFKDFKEAPKVKKSFNQRWKDNRLKKGTKNKAENKAGQPHKKVKVDKLDPVVSSEKVVKSKKNNKRKCEEVQKDDPVFKKSKPDITHLQAKLDPKPNIKSLPKKNKSLRENKKQKRDKEKDKEEKFQSLISSYKNKLISQDTQQVNFKKWYED